MEARLPLAGIRVLEHAEGIAGPTAGWLLREAGAEVLKVERPEGDRLRGSLGFHALNRGKGSVVLDLGDESHREELRRLAAAADVVVVDEAEGRLERVGLGYDARKWPSLVWCSAPMFGRHGPRAGLPPDDALVEAASGIAAMQWSYARTPVHLVTPITSYATGFLAALGITAALVARAATGRGQRVDTSGLAGAMLLQCGTYVRGPGHEGSLASQAHDPRGVFPTYGLYATADGWIFVGALTEAFWTKLAGLIDRSDLLAAPDFAGSPLGFGKPAARVRLRAELEPIFAARPTAEWLRRFEEADVPIGRVQSRRDYLDEATAAANQAMIEINDPDFGVIRQAGAPFVFDYRLPPPPEPAPRLDPDARPSFAKKGNVPVSQTVRRLGAPLEGLRILDLSSFIAGPVCPMLLADLGAEDGPARWRRFALPLWNGRPDHPVAVRWW